MQTDDHPAQVSGTHAGADPSAASARSADGAVTLTEIRDSLRQFALDRDWDQFHSPKNLAMALTGELGELCELMQWKTDQQVLEDAEHDANYKQRLGEELSDVLCYLVRLSDRLGVDLGPACLRKIEQNACKYPVAECKGSAKKYNELKHQHQHPQQE